MRCAFARSREAPADATPLAAVRAGLERAASSMTPLHRELGPGLIAVSSGNPELQARNAAKQAGLTAAMSTALREHGVAEPLAAVAAGLGGLAFTQAYAAWIAGGDDHDLGELVRTALEQVHRATAEL